VRAGGDHGVKWTVTVPGVLGLLCLIFLLRHRLPTTGKTAPSLMIEERHKQIVKGPAGQTLKSGYMVYLPTAYSESNRQWPLVLFLHGSGASGSDLDRVAAASLPKRTREKDFPFVILAPQCPGEDDWTFPGQQQRISDLLEDITKRYSIDERRVYATGCSMGGYAVWRLAYSYPHRFAAVAPICGVGSPGAAERMKDLPVWVFHGALDSRVPVEASRKMVKALRENGSPVRYTEYPDAGHDSWTRTFNNPEFFEWLLSQRQPLESQVPD